MSTRGRVGETAGLPPRSPVRSGCGRDARRASRASPGRVSDGWNIRRRRRAALGIRLPGAGNGTQPRRATARIDDAGVDSAALVRAAARGATGPDVGAGQPATARIPRRHIAYGNVGAVVGRGLGRSGITAVTGFPVGSRLGRLGALSAALAIGRPDRNLISRCLVG